MTINWVSTLQNLLQVAAFCLVVATTQYAFSPERPYGPSVAYSLCIGLIIWAVIDMGRHLFPSSAETGWPQGFNGVALPMMGIATGFFLGNVLGNFVCLRLGLYTGPPPANLGVELRNGLLVTLLSGVAASYYFYSVNRGQYLERKMGEARQHANEARLKLLETQLEPHMLFNTLANLRALIGVDPARAQVMLDHMIAYLRATLSASRSTRQSLQAETDRLRDYLELMAIRMGPRLKYDIVVPPELAEVRVPALLLQPIVENSIQHGLEPKVEGGTITVTAQKEADALVLTIADTGVGARAPSGMEAHTTSNVRSPAQADHPASANVSAATAPASTFVPAKAGTQSAHPHARGFGLTQVRERLHTVYGPAASMQFTTTPGKGARTEIRIPLHA